MDRKVAFGLHFTVYSCLEKGFFTVRADTNAQAMLHLSKETKGARVRYTADWELLSILKRHTRVVIAAESYHDLLACKTNVDEGMATHRINKTLFCVCYR